MTKEERQTKIYEVGELASKIASLMNEFDKDFNSDRPILVTVESRSGSLYGNSDVDVQAQIMLQVGKEANFELPNSFSADGAYSRVDYKKVGNVAFFTLKE